MSELGWRSNDATSDDPGMLAVGQSTPLRTWLGVVNGEESLQSSSDRSSTGETEHMSRAGTGGTRRTDGRFRHA
jgi:hypothetical protein